MPRLALALWLGVTAAVIARAERLSVKIYTTADGLVSNRIIRDSRGFLWFCTEEGLSKFDGYTLTTASASLRRRALRPPRTTA